MKFDTASFPLDSRRSPCGLGISFLFKGVIGVLLLCQFGCNSGGGGGSVSKDIPPDPENLTASVTSTTQIDLSWASGGGSTTGYRIAYDSGASAPADCSGAGGATLIDASAITGTSLTVTSLASGTQYSFRVCAIDANPPTTVSGGVIKSATTLSLPPSDPLSLTAITATPSLIQLSWVNGGGSTAGYRIAYRTGSDPGDCLTGTVINENDISATTYQISGLSPNTTYYFRLCAVNTNPTPDVSVGISATATTYLALPPDPAALSATVVSPSEIDLSWSSGGGTTAGYRIAYKNSFFPGDCSTGTVINESTVSGTSYNVTGLSPNTQYYFLVCAINTNTPTEVSAGAAATATTQILPYSLSLSTVSASAATLLPGDSSSLTLTVRDNLGNQLSHGGSTVIFGLGTGTSRGTFGPVTDHNDGTYSTVFTADTTGVGNATKITATIDGYSIASSLPTIDVNAGPADPGQSTISATPTAVYAGLDVAITVTVRDQYGNQKETGADTVIVTNSMNAGESAGNMSAVTDNGNGTYSATFSTTGAGTPTTISGQINGNDITSSHPTVTVNSCNVTQVTWATNPNASITAGDNFTIGRVKLQDAANHICGTGIGLVTFSLDPSTNPRGVTLKGTATATPINGYAYVTSANIQTAGTYNLLAALTAAPSIKSAASSDVTVKPGTATHIVFTHLTPKWPAGGSPGTVTVQLAREDDYGNIYQGSGGSVALALSDPMSATLSGTTSMPFTSGIVTFIDLAIDNVGTAYRLKATNGSLSETSLQFDVIDPVGAGLNLDVPVEMLDQSVGNRVTTTAGTDVVPVSTVGLNAANFTGTVTYSFEIVASNNTGAPQQVDLYDNRASSAVANSGIVVPDAVTTPTLYRSPSITLTGDSTYSIEIPRLASGVANTIVVYSARIIVHQVDATNTAIYIPLISDVNTNINSLYGAIDTVSANNGLSQGSQDRYAIWNKDTTNMADVQANGYTLEAVVSGTSTHKASVALYNESKNIAVIACTGSRTSSPTYCSSSDFDAVTVPNFDEPDDFDLRLDINGTTGNAKIYKGGLWIRLENLSKYDTYWRTSRLYEGASSASIDQTSRQQIDTSNFSNPSISHQCTGAMTSTGDLAIDLASFGTDDSGTASPVPITNSTVTFGSAAPSLVTATGLSGMISGDRFMSEITGSTGTLDVTQCVTIVGKH